MLNQLHNRPLLIANLHINNDVDFSGSSYNLDWIPATKIISLVIMRFIINFLNDSSFKVTLVLLVLSKVRLSELMPTLTFLVATCYQKVEF